MRPLSQKKNYISQIYCFECGTKLELLDKFCPNCGNDTKVKFQSTQNE